MKEFDYICLAAAAVESLLQTAPRSTVNVLQLSKPKILAAPA